MIIWPSEHQTPYKTS